MITARQLGLALPAALAAGRIATWYQPLVDAMTARAITTPNRIAYFLANVAEETGQLQARSENLNYSGDRLMEVFPSLFNGNSALAYATAAGGPEAIANFIYADANRPRGYRMGNIQPGDGWKYRGRGPMENTGRQNYERFFNSIGAPVNSDPDLLLTPKYGALAAAQFWADAGCNALADAGKFTDCVVKVNGGTLGLAARLDYLKRFQDALAHPDPVAASKPIVVQPVAAPIVLPEPLPVPAVTSADYAVEVPPMPPSITIASEPAPVEVTELKLKPELEPIAAMSPVPPTGYSVQPGGNITRDNLEDSAIMKASKWGKVLAIGGTSASTAAGVASQAKDLLGGIGPVPAVCLIVVAVVFGVLAFFAFRKTSNERVTMHNNGIA